VDLLLLISIIVKMIVDIHIPLFMDSFSPKTVWNMIYILEKMDIAANYPIEQTSSGFELFQNGYLDDAKKIGEKFIREFNNDRAVIVPSAQHAAFIRNDYTKLFNNTAFHNEFKQLQKTVFEFTDYIVNQEDITKLRFSFSAIVSMHLGCSERKYGTAHNLRKLLESIEGTKIVEMEDAEACCGNGGGFSFHNREAAMEMGEKLIQKQAAVDYILGTDLSCLYHLRASNPDTNIKFMHIIDYLAMALKED
jgi:L-lactate dehydrogenase complex protein LldE